MTPNETRVMELVLMALKSGITITSDRFDKLMVEAEADNGGDSQS